MKSMASQFHNPSPNCSNRQGAVKGIGGTTSPDLETGVKKYPKLKRKIRGLRLPVVGGLLGVLLSAGCYETAHHTEPARAQKKASEEQLFSGSRFNDGMSSQESLGKKQQGNKIVKQYDLNRDGKPDVWKYFLVRQDGGKTSQQLVSKEFDVNFDGRIDVFRFYDQSQMISKESFDLDFDGRIDQVNFYENGQVVRKEKDLNYDKKTDLWIYCEKGIVARKERDSNNDGRVDYWEYWENGQVDRIGEDLDGDGTVDRWSKSQAQAQSE